MSTKDNEVNRAIDGEADGHRFRGIIEQAEDAGKKASKKNQLEDAETEGHKWNKLEDVKVEALKRI